MFRKKEQRKKEIASNSLGGGGRYTNFKGSSNTGLPLTHHVEENVARCQHHLLACRSVVNSHVAFIGAVVRDPDLRKSVGGKTRRAG